MFSGIVQWTIHPQWLALRWEKRHLTALGARAHRQVQDIGYRKHKPRRYFSTECHIHAGWFWKNRKP
jgi:hypothetical protein